VKEKEEVKNQRALILKCVSLLVANTRRKVFGKRVIGIMAAILTAMHMQTADDLFGTPSGSPRTDRLIDASIQWAERIMQKTDHLFAGK
jgi:hypothetical protein